MNTAGPAHASRHDFEMGITRSEFLRLLPLAVGSEPYRIEGDDIVAEGRAIAWRVRIEERPGRPFGSLTLPVLAVQLVLDGASGPDARAFVDRFLLGFQRAGG